jgi:uncharacterized membrane protein YoaK (UPF0700 family)
MLGARARTLLFASVGGAVDAIGFLLLFGIFTAHMSGDTTRLAVDLGTGVVGPDALARVVVLGTFVVGLVIGVVVVAVTDGRGTRALAFEIVVLAAVMVAGAVARDHGALGHRSALFPVLVGLLALAMGVQNGFLRRVAGTSVHTTFVTGMLTAMAEDAVAAWRDGDDHRARRRLRLHGGIWAAYLAGGAAGAALALEWGFWAVTLPIAGLGVVLTGGGLRTEPATP